MENKSIGVPMLSHCTLSRFCLREMRLQVREMEDKQPFAASPTGSPLRKNLAGSVCPKCQFFLGELAAFWGFAPVALECAGMYVRLKLLLGFVASFGWQLVSGK